MEQHQAEYHVEYYKVPVLYAPKLRWKRTCLTYRRRTDGPTGKGIGATCCQEGTRRRGNEGGGKGREQLVVVVEKEEKEEEGDEAGALFAWLKPDCRPSGS
jgi:hypothetical protein